jgi:hypothetical protein
MSRGATGAASSSACLTGLGRAMLWSVEFDHQR